MAFKLDYGWPLTFLILVYAALGTGLTLGAITFSQGWSQTNVEYLTVGGSLLALALVSLLMQERKSDRRLRHHIARCHSGECIYSGTETSWVVDDYVGQPEGEPAKV